MFVKIIKTKDFSWYKNLVGKTLKVRDCFDENSEYYLAFSRKGKFYLVIKNDCEIIKEIK